MHGQTECIPSKGGIHSVLQRWQCAQLQNLEQSDFPKKFLCLRSRLIGGDQLASVVSIQIKSYRAIINDIILQRELKKLYRRHCELNRKTTPKVRRRLCLNK